jgi:repressor LexA
VIVESRWDAADGDTVVALVRGHEVTLKKLQRKGERVRLVPANAALRPLELPAADVAIQGVVRGLLRRY